MPRIDPLQLLKCLSVLLSPEGGILSRDEVPRLVNLMTKFSKKLVSKCVYILILKNSEKSLLDLFMTEGGWHLIYRWLEDAVSIGNYNLVGEILTLLLITPVDVDRLKMNNISKLVKNLSRREDLGGVYDLSVRLVEDWLKIAKGVTRIENLTIRTGPAIDEITGGNNLLQTVQMDELQDQALSTVDGTQIETKNNKMSKETTLSPCTFYKITDRDGKQVISKVEEITESPIISEIVVVAETDGKKDERNNKTGGENRNRTRNHSSSSSKNRSSSNSSSSKSKSSNSSSNSNNKDKHRSSSSSSSKNSKDRDRDKDRKDREKYKEKHKSNGLKSPSNSSSSNNNKDKDKNKGEVKEKQAEKDKDTLAKLKPQSIDKLGRIPKKSSSGGNNSEEKTNKESDDVKKKPTMSIEVRKSNSTVKVYQSKMRSTGLEEEVRPPGPRTIKKPSSSSSSITLPVIPKRTSPIKDLTTTPPEKKLKMDLPERPGSIKLIPPKPKPSVLQESDIFMDALAASASSKKEPKRRKRRLSVSKDTPESPTTASQDPPQSAITSPLGLKNIAAPNFYQDTLETDKSDEKSNDDERKSDDENPGTPTDNSMDMSDIRPLSDGGLKGILVDPKKKKAQKKSIKWRADSDLVEVRLFDLDENERVNVSRTFLDMAKMEMTSEREALLLSRKLPNEDMMETQIPWKPLYLIDYIEPLHITPGHNSKEKGIQYAREITVLKALYFDKRKIPDSPEEPMPENHQMIDPIIMPLEDADSQEMDLRNTPWPEPKGSPPPPTENKMPQQIFPNMQVPFQSFSQLPPPNFPGLGPRFGLSNNQQGPGVFGGPNMMPNGNMLGTNMGPPPDMMHQGPLNPNIFGPCPGPDNFNPMVNDNVNNFPMPFNPPNMNMFPQNNFNMNRGGGGGGGGRGFRRGGGNNSGPWIRMNGSGNWNRGGMGGGGGGGGHRGGRLCKNIKIHGFCRNMDNCPFIHPS